MIEYDEILKGVVVLTRYPKPMTDFARSLRVAILEEQEKIEQDNGRLELLCDAARIGKELITIATERCELVGERDKEISELKAERDFLKGLVFRIGTTEQYNRYVEFNKARQNKELGVSGKI